jgi:hypothetical protein
MDHNDIRHKLSELIDGVITPGEKADIERHLKTCTECSDALRELKKTIEHIHEIEDVESPAWMTQKIMAKVREDADRKKNLWQRVFVPLFTMFPVQAVAVLFLAITAYFIYANINPAQKYTEKPVGMLAKKEAPAVGRMKEGDKMVPEKAPETKRESHKPGYKSLDMKYEYERPAPPVPQERIVASAPAPAKQAEQMLPAKKAESVERRARPLQKDAPSQSVKLATSLSVKSAGLSSGVSGDAEHTKEVVSAEDQVKSTMHARSYLEFIRTIERFPYEAPQSKKDRIANNYVKLKTGMTKVEIVFIMGEPDYSSDAQALDPPFRRQGTYWTYNLAIKDPKLVSLDTDQYLNIFFDVREKAYSFSPHNLPGLAPKGESLDTSK